MDHLKFMVDSIGFGGPGFTNMFFGMKWKAYIAFGDEIFITTDSPVVEKWPPPQGFYGASFLNRDKYFALTPRILIELTYPRGARKVKRKALYKKHSDQVKTLNMILISNAKEFAYSGNKAILEGLLAGRDNPGPLEMAYIDKYERPWEEYRMKRKS